MAYNSRNISDIKTAVRKLLDQNSSIPALSGFDNTDTLELNDIIEQCVVPAVKWAHNNAPRENLNGISISPEITWDDYDNSIGHCSLPTDLMRLLSFRVGSWNSGVHELITDDCEQYRQMLSPYPGLRGTTNHPVVALINGASGRTIQFFSSKGDTQISSDTGQILDGSFESRQGDKWHPENSVVQLNFNWGSMWMSCNNVDTGRCGAVYGDRDNIFKGNAIIQSGHKYYVQVLLGEFRGGSLENFYAGQYPGPVLPHGRVINEKKMIHGIFTAQNRDDSYDFAIVDAGVSSKAIDLTVKYAMLFDLTVLGLDSLTEDECLVKWPAYVKPANTSLIYLPEPAISSGAISIEDSVYDAFLYYLAHLVCATYGNDSKFVEIAQGLLA